MNCAKGHLFIVLPRHREATEIPKALAQAVPEANHQQDTEWGGVVFGRKKQEAQPPRPEDTVAPPEVFPDGAPFPGQQHLEALDRVRTMGFAHSRTEDRLDFMRICLLVERLIRNPAYVPLTWQLLEGTMSAAQHLADLGLEPQRAQYAQILDDLREFWKQDGSWARLMETPPPGHETSPFQNP